MSSKKRKDDRGGLSGRDLDAYKRDLDQLFRQDGKTPDRFAHLSAQLQAEDAQEDDGAGAAWREAVQGLRDAQAEGFRPFVAAASAFVRDGHALPEDEDLLIRLLDHPAEPVLRATLERLIGMQAHTPLTRHVALNARMGTIETMSEDPRTHRLVRQLREAMRG